MKQHRNGPGGRVERAILISAACGPFLLRKIHGIAPREAKRMAAAGLVAIEGKGEDARVRLTEAGRIELFGAREVSR